jgi:isoprenylcysteine carboxyl methyltransferase (ICMT) family protein YpbQ
MGKWMILTSYFGAGFVNGVAWATLIPIPEKAMDYYGIDESEMTLYSYIFAITSVGLAPCSSWLISKSFYITLHTISIVNVVGCWIRYMSRSNFWISVLGQSIIASGNILQSSCCSTLAHIWFPESKVVLATSIAISSNFVGIGFGFLYMSYSDNISQMMLIQAFVSSFFFLFNIIVLKKDIKKEDSISFSDSVKIAFKDQKLLVMTISIGSEVGVNYAIIPLFGLLLESENYSTIDIGWVGFSYLMSGLIGGLFATYISGIKNSVATTLIFFLVFSVISSFLFVGLIKFHHITILTSGLYGSFLIGSIPLGIRRCVEHNPYIKESIPTNMIVFFAQLFSCIYTYPILYFKDFSKITGFWLSSFIVLVSFTVYYLYIEKFNTTKSQNLSEDKSEKKDSEEESEQIFIDEKGEVDTKDKTA